MDEESGAVKGSSPHRAQSVGSSALSTALSSDIIRPLSSFARSGAPGQLTSPGGLQFFRLCHEPFSDIAIIGTLGHSTRISAADFRVLGQWSCDGSSHGEIGCSSPKLTTVDLLALL